MTGFCGWIGFEEGPDELKRHAELMANALGRSGAARTSAQVSDRVAMISVDGPSRLSVTRSNGHIAAVWGRPTLTLPDSSRTVTGEAVPEELIGLFLEHREEALPYLGGAFAVAILSESGRTALIAVDRMGGRHPVGYTKHGESIVFGTDTAAIRAHPSVESKLDSQSLYNYLYFGVVPSPRSIITGVSFLTPGSFLSLKDGHGRVGRYWEPHYTEDSTASLEELAEEFRSLVRSSVQAGCGTGQTGCFLSGGTDSSTVAGTLAQVGDGKARTYSIGFGTEGFDELEYARLAARRFDTDQHEYLLTPDDLLERIPDVAHAYSEPFGNASALPSYQCARLAQSDGTQTMLAGDGGDELFAGNQRYAKQKTFEAYGRLPAPVRRWIVEPVLSGMPGLTGVPLVGKVRSYVQQARIPMPRRLETYNFVERLGRERIIEPDFLQAIDPDEPLSTMERVYDGADAGSLVNRMLALDMKYTLADNDLPKVSRMCELAGVEVSYPFLEDAMVEFSCRVPSRLKLKGQKLRWFQKYAMRNFLPDEILHKKKQGFGLPFGIWMAEHPPLRDYAHSSLDGLKSRGVVRAAFIDELLRLHDQEHAGYYGVMIWTLMMLEQWFRAHWDTASLSS